MTERDVQNRGVYKYIMNDDVFKEYLALDTGIAGPHLATGAVFDVDKDRYLRYPKQGDVGMSTKIELVGGVGDMKPIQPWPKGKPQFKDQYKVVRDDYY